MDPITAAVAAAPYRTCTSYLRHKPVLAQSSYVMLASALFQASSQNDDASRLTIPRIFAVLALLREDGGVGGEACKLLKSLAKNADLSEIVLAPELFEKLLRSFAEFWVDGLGAVQPILYEFAQRVAAAEAEPNLTLPRCLAVAAPIEHWPLRDAKSLEVLDLDNFETRLNSRYGSINARDTALYFAHKAVALIEVRGDFAAAFVFAAAALAAKIHARGSPSYTVQLLAISELLSTGELGAFPRELLPKPVRAALAELCQCLRPLEKVFTKSDLTELDKELSQVKNLLGQVSPNTVRLAWTAHRLKSAFTTVTRARSSDLKLDISMVKQAVDSYSLGSLCLTIDDAGIITRQQASLARLRLWVSRAKQLSETIMSLRDSQAAASNDVCLAEAGLTPTHSNTAGIMDSD